MRIAGKYIYCKYVQGELENAFAYILANTFGFLVGLGKHFIRPRM